MITFRTLSAMTAGFVLLTAGCIGSADVVDDVDLSVDSVSMGVLDQGSGLNGLWPPNFTGNKAALLTATKVALTGGFNSHVVNPAIVSNTNLVDGTAAGKETFAYAVKCMLPLGDYVEYNTPSGIDSYYGAGIIDPSAWQTQPLTPMYREALFECMMAHLNGFNVTVPIAYQGSFVHLDERIDEYTAFEALWLAKDTGGSMPVLEAFPGDWFDARCQETASSLINRRVCADPAGYCGISVRSVSDRKARCKEDPAGNWTCDGKPVLKTKLDPYTMSGMYVGCGTP